jgi:hypothetical protein
LRKNLHFLITLSLILIAVYLDAGSGKDINIRLLVAFPGALLSGVGLVFYSRIVSPFSKKVAANFVFAGSFMFCCAMLTGIVPSDVIFIKILSPQILPVNK